MTALTEVISVFGPRNRLGDIGTGVLVSTHVAYSLGVLQMGPQDSSPKPLSRRYVIVFVDGKQ